MAFVENQSALFRWVCDRPFDLMVRAGKMHFRPTNYRTRLGVRNSFLVLPEAHEHWKHWMPYIFESQGRLFRSDPKTVVDFISKDMYPHMKNALQRTLVVYNREHFNPKRKHKNVVSTEAPRKILRMRTILKDSTADYITEDDAEPAFVFRYQWTPAYFADESTGPMFKVSKCLADCLSSMHRCPPLVDFKKLMCDFGETTKWEKAVEVVLGNISKKVFTSADIPQQAAKQRRVLIETVALYRIVGGLFAKSRSEVAKQSVLIVLTKMCPDGHAALLKVGALNGKQAVAKMMNVLDEAETVAHKVASDWNRDQLHKRRHMLWVLNKFVGSYEHTSEIFSSYILSVYPTLVFFNDQPSPIS
jgi:hypothetical protein